MSFYPDDLSKWLVSREIDGSSSDGYPGYDPSLTQDVEETINNLGLGFMVTPSDAGETVTVRSTNAGDVGNVIVLAVLDENGLAKIGLAILNGQTPVNVTNTDFTPLLVSRVNVVVNRSTAPHPNNATPTQGDVLVRNLADDTTYGGFLAIDQRSFCLLFTVPSDRTGFFLPAEATINRSGNQDASVTFRTKTRIKGGPWLNNGRWGLQKGGTSAFIFESFDRPEIPPFTDIMITAEATSTNTEVTGRVPIWTTRPV